MIKGIAAAGGGLAGLVLFVAVLGSGADLAEGEPPAGGCTVAPPGGPGGHTPPGQQQQTQLNAQQMAVAQQIVGVGKGMQIGERGVAIALGTAMQESTMDPTATSPGGRSLGLYQQQGSLYAGVDRADPVASSAAFYRMLQQRVPNYADPGAIGFADVAQKVQASGAGAQWYARWEQWATGLAHQLGTGDAGAGGDVGGVQCSPGGGSGPLRIELHGTEVELPPQAGARGTVRAPSPQAATAIAAGLSYLGTDYAWGGGDPAGPTKGIRDGGTADRHGDYNKQGFDCAGLTQYAYAQARINLTRPASSQLSTARTTVGFAQAQPGDLLFYGARPHHVAIYLGDVDGKPMMLEAPQSGEHVKVSPVRTGGDFQANQVVRPA